MLLFGAGHVGKALARALAPLPLRVRWIDGRADAFPDPAIAGPEVVVSERLLAEVEAAPAGAAYLVLTHSHALDSMICAAALQRGDFAYLGLIGSRTKRARSSAACASSGIPQEQIDAPGLPDRRRPAPGQAAGGDRGAGRGRAARRRSPMRRRRTAQRDSGEAA